MKAVIAFFARQHALSNVITLFVVVIGIASLLLIRRDAFPPVNFDIITVRTIWPGSGADEVEKLVTNPIEQELKAVDGVRKITSDSTENLSEIRIELDPDETTEDKGKREVQEAVDRWSERPADVETPIVTALNSKQFPVIEISLSSQKVDDFRLREVARLLRKKIEMIDDVARVVPLGYQDVELQVEADPGLLQRFRVSLQELIDALKGQNVSIPAGELSQSASTEKIVRTLGEFRTEKEAESTVVRANELGEPIRVGDIARAKFGLEEPDQLRRSKGKPGVALLILKTERADAIELAEKVRKAAEKEIKAFAADEVAIDFVNDISRDIKLRISILNDNLLVGGLLVILVLAIALPIRLALVVSLAIPFSYLATITLFYMMGASINLVSLIGFILVTGLLVDNTVVIADNCYRKMQEGMEPEEAVVEGTYEVWASVAAAALVTMAAFAPMAAMSGIFGKFVREVPLAIILALIVTLLQGFFILPSQLATWVRPPSPKDEAKGQRGWRKSWQNVTHKAWEFYGRILRLAVKMRYLVLVAATLLFGGALFMAAKTMRVILFPPDGIEIFFIQAEAPTETSLDGTLSYMKPIEAAVARLSDKELEAFTTTVGVIQNDTEDPLSRRGSQLGQVAVYLTPSQDRERSADQIIASLREELGTPKGLTRVTFARAQGGPPVGKPISIGVQGDTYEEILPAAKEIESLAKGAPGVEDVTNSYLPGKEEVRVRVIGNEARAVGLNVADVGNTVRAALDGIVATSIRSLDEEIDVRVSLLEKNRNPMGILNNLKIPNRNGDLVPLIRIARFESGRSLATYEHEDNRREVRVFGEVDINQTSANEANELIRQHLPALEQKYPQLRFVFGGEDQDTRESFASLGRAFVVAIFIIFLILVTLFKQVWQPILLILTIPLGAIAVIFTLFVHRMPISFMGMLGIIALSGVIVNNAIVLIDFVNQNRAKGMEKLESIYDAAGVRLRPVMLT
ncbi:MAG: efflux RND transporter permease subunit, partial [Pseudobdellovibrionaceae bacterium]|nr:efflux RND transporter permease subunit [Pseudobdellovibrionaceae bacterium]